MDGVALDGTDVDDWCVDDTAVAMSTRDNGFGAAGDERIGLRVGRDNGALGRDAALEVVAGKGVVAGRCIPLIDRHVEAVDEAGTYNVVAVVLIEKRVVVDMEGVAFDFDSTYEVSGTFVEIDGVETHHFTHTRLEVTSPADGTRLRDIEMVVE